MPSNTFKKERDDNDAATGHGLGFPPVREGPWEGRGISDALQEGTAAPTGVTASVPNKPTRISPNPQPITTPDDPSRSTILAVHQYAPPRTRSHHRRLTVTSEARPAGSRGTSRKRGAAGSAATWEGTTSTTLGGDRPDVAQEQTRHPCPAEPEAGS